MPQDTTARPPRYHTFLLSLWAEAGSAPEWRCSLEDPHTGERMGFTSPEELAAYLWKWMRQHAPDSPAP